MIEQKMKDQLEEEKQGQGVGTRNELLSISDNCLMKFIISRHF